MKEYFNIIKNNNIVEFDGTNISIYERSTFGTRYLPNMNYWKGTQEELIDKLKAQIIYKSSNLGKVLEGES